ncbi:potassium channel family protein [Pseudomonas sp. LB3P38]|uniref:potassium channel family protein n=1 Tax=Pseudomonas lyxosi TaxID=3398358 RepID=UPI0039F08AE2
MKHTHASNVRREFFKAIGFYLRVVWPIFSVLFFLIVLFGLIISYLEGWDLFDGIYFGFVTGLTIGYGELVPKLGVSRILAILLGFNGVLMTAIFAAISVRAIEVAVRAAGREESDTPTA